MPRQISRAAYADVFGPTVGDKVRLADTDLFIESGGDNLAARARRADHLRDRRGGGPQDPAQGRPGHHPLDLLVINKIDLAPLVGADLHVMERDARRLRGERPFVFTNIRAGAGVQETVDFIRGVGGLA